MQLGNDRNCGSIFCFKVKQKFIVPFAMHFQCKTCHLDYICERCARLCHNGHKLSYKKNILPRICYCGVHMNCSLILSHSKKELLKNKY